MTKLVNNDSPIENLPNINIVINGKMDDDCVYHMFIIMLTNQLFNMTKKFFETLRYSSRVITWQQMSRKTQDKSALWQSMDTLIMKACRKAEIIF